MCTNFSGSSTTYLFSQCLFQHTDLLWTVWTFCIVVSGTLTLRLPTDQPRDIPTHTIRPPNILSTVTIFYCDTSTMWHFSTVTFRLCDNFLLWHSVSKWTDCPSTPKSGYLSHCDIPTHCNIGQPMAVIFCPIQNSISTVTTLSKLPLIWTDDDLLTLSL